MVKQLNPGDCAHISLASCQWGPATAHGVGKLTEFWLQQEQWLQLDTHNDRKNHRPLLWIIMDDIS